MKKNNGMILTGIVALSAVSVAIIAATIFFSPPSQQLGGIDCLFYSAQSKSSVYAVYATLSNNSTSPIVIERVYFDGSERAYSAEFLAYVGGIWSMRVGGQSTNVLGAGNFSTLLLTAKEANPDIAHTVRVVTNVSNIEFNVEQKYSSLIYNHYSVFEGPGLDYMIAHIECVGTATGNIVQVALDGIDYEYVYNMRPPVFKCQWSMVVGGNPTSFIGTGQQAQIYVNITGICHTCTHILRIACSDGSSVEFSFNPR